MFLKKVEESLPLRVTEPGSGREHTEYFSVLVCLGTLLKACFSSVFSVSVDRTQKGKGTFTQVLAPAARSAGALLKALGLSASQG